MIVSLVVNFFVLTAALKAAKMIVSNPKHPKQFGEQWVKDVCCTWKKGLKIGEKKKTEEEDLYLFANLSIITFSSFQLKSESF